MTRKDKLKIAMEIYNEWLDGREQYYKGFGLWLQIEIDEEPDDESDTLWD